MNQISKVVLAFSGGLDTTAACVWLKENFDCKVVALCIDVGQREDFSEVERRAKICKADDFLLVDIKEHFVSDFVFPMMRANPSYEGYLLGTAIARPAIAKKQIEIAEKLDADAVSHGATAKGNDQVRFEITYLSLNPKIKILPVWRIWNFKGRKDLIKYLSSKNIKISVTEERPYSIDANIYHTSYEGGILEDPANEPPNDMFLMTKNPEDAPEKPEYVTIGFERGDPVSIDGEKLSPFDLLNKLNNIAGRHGIGRCDVVETRINGLKSRGVYETPGGTLILFARKSLEGLCLDGEVLRLKESLSPYYSSLIYKGLWFSPERQLLQKFIDSVSENLNGYVKLKLYKGNVYTSARNSDYSLYKKEVISFDTAGTGIEPSWAEGFIRTLALRFAGK